MIIQPKDKQSFSLVWPMIQILVLALLILKSCEVPSEGPSEIQEVIVAVQSIPDNMVPIMRQNSQAKMLNDLIYQGLTCATGIRQNEIKTELAEKIEQNQERRNEYSVILRRDVQWHSGRSFSAQDVIFTWESIKNEVNESPLRGRLMDIITSVDMLDNYTIKVTFKYSVAPDDALWLLSFKIIPSYYGGQEMPTNLASSELGRRFAEKPIGTGPYKFLERRPNLVKLEAFESNLAIRRILFKLQEDAALRVRKLIDEYVDLVFNVDPEKYVELDAEGIPFSEYIPKAFYAIAFNSQNSITCDSHFREGVAAAIDRTAIVNEIWGPGSENYTLHGPFPYNDHHLYRRLKSIQNFDSEYAIKQIQTSTYNGEIVRLMINEGMGSIGRIAGQRISEILEEVGIQVKIYKIGRAFYSRLLEGNFQMALILEDGFGRKYDHFTLYYSSGSRNVTRIRNTQLDKILLNWENSIIMKDKYPLTERMNDLLSELTPYAYLFTTTQRVYYSKRLQNVTIINEDALLKTLPEWSKSY